MSIFALNMSFPGKIISSYPNILSRFADSVSKSMLPIGRTDNRLVENISEKCRPSNIAQLYNTLESQEWVDAKETLEDITDFREEDIVQFLCACVMVSKLIF